MKFLQILRVVGAGLAALQHFTDVAPFLPAWVGLAVVVASTVIKDVLNLVPEKK